MFSPFASSVRYWYSLRRFGFSPCTWISALPGLPSFVLQTAIYRKDDDSTLGIVLTYSLAFISLGALLIKVNAQPNGEMERRIFEIVLIFLLLMGLGLIIVNFLRSFCMKRLKCCRKRNMMPGQRRALTNRIEMFLPARQVSLVRSQDSKAKFRLPRTGLDDITKFVDNGSHDIESEFTQPGATNPMTTVEDEIELKEIKKKNYQE